MKLKLLALSIIMALLATAGLHADVDEVAVYLKPSQQDNPIEYLPSSHTVIQNAQPLETSGKGPQWYKSTWEWDAYSDFSNGYVPKSAVKNDGTLEPGTPIYLRKDTTSSVVAKIKPQDTIHMTDEGDWMAVDIEKTTTVYFQKQSTTHSPMVAQIQAETEQHQAQVTPAPTKVATYQPAPAHSTTDSVSSNAMTRHFEGVLKQYASFMGSHPKYRYVLTDHEGHNIAFIDTRELLLDRPLNKFYNESVVLLGDVSPNTGHRKEHVPLIIQAKTIRHM